MGFDTTIGDMIYDIAAIASYGTVDSPEFHIRKIWTASASGADFYFTIPITGGELPSGIAFPPGDFIQYSSSGE